MSSEPVGRADPSVDEIRRRRVFDEPLEPNGEPSAGENAALWAALEHFARRTARDDFRGLSDFLEAHPESVWEKSLRTLLGVEFYRTGHFSKALRAWEQVWQTGRPEGANGVLNLSVQRSATELAKLYSRLGRMPELRRLLQDLDGYQLMGNYAQQLNGPRQGLWSMENRPEISFRCGPLALDRIRAWGHPTNACDPLIFSSKSTTNGISMGEVAKLSAALGMNYQVAFRSPGAAMVVPSVIHWKVGHYAAIVREAHGLFLTQDPTFVNDTWVSSSTVDDEASGYFLIPPGPLRPGWRSADEKEAGLVWGKGVPNMLDADATTEDDPTLDDADQVCKEGGMASWDFNLMLLNQKITDTPIGYRPPFGPPVFFSVTMNAQDNWMRAFPSWWGTTLGMDWSCNWSSFVQQDTFNPSANLRLYDRGGWFEFIEDPNQPGIFRCQFLNPGYIQIVATNGITFGYRWIMPDGTSRSYSRHYAPSGAFYDYSLMTAVLDAAGNSVTIEYDDNFPGRINAIVDALGQRTTFEYGLTDPGAPPPSPISQGNVQFHWQVTKITDPFGRSANFQYQLVQDGSPPAYIYFMTNITDVVGMSSQIDYANGFAISSLPFVSSLTTPYGTTKFHPFVLGNLNFGFEITDPNGDVERLQVCNSQGVDYELLQNVPQGMLAQNGYLYARNVFYWNKKAYAEGFSPTNYAAGTIYHFTHGRTLAEGGRMIESIKRPLENRIWFNYPGQGNGWFPGTDDHPSKIGRVLDDGTTQLWQFDRNELGNIARSIDPVGRTFSFVYASNGMDLLEVRQTRNGKNELVAKATYNAQHLPLTLADAAGQTTTMTYNSRGQPLSITTPKNETTSFGYDANGYLVYVDGPLPGTQDRDTFSYDATGRVRTVTDAEGYSIVLDYDNLDRLTRVTFPDGTYQAVTYDRLRPGTVRDRLGRTTTYTYTTLGQLASIQDPLGRLTRFQWCRCSDLEALIDPAGRMTSWQRDIEGRVTAKIYADGSIVRCGHERNTARLHSILDEQNQLTEFEYYADDSLKAKRYPNAAPATPSVQFTYDPDYPRVVTMQDGNGTTTYSYNPILSSPSLGAGLLAAIDGPWPNDTITMGYDERGRVISQAINGVGVQRVFDAIGRLTRLTNILGAFDLTWEGGSTRLSTVHYANGQHSQYAYYPNQGDQLLQRVTHFRPDNSVLSEFTYAYNPESQVTNWTQLQGGVLGSGAAIYDAVDRLLKVTVTQGASVAHTFAYAYDDADNRSMELVDSTRRDFYYNPLNQLVAISNSANAGVSYEWDAANRLVAISNGTHQTEFSYDGYGRRTRVVERDNGAMIDARRYVWCGEQLCEERDDTGGIVLKRYSSFGVSSEAASDLPPGHYYFTRDSLLSVREMSDASGSLRAQFDYLPYGQRQRLAGDLEAGFGFTGHFLHSPSSLLLAPFRAYDVSLGRWLNRDPIAELEGLNRYAYAGNNPANQVDLTGLAPKAAPLVANTAGYQQAQAGIDAYEQLKTAHKTLDAIADKGAKEVVRSELEDRGKKAMEEIAPGAKKEQERLLDEAAKTGKQSIDPMGKLVGDKYRDAANALGGGGSCAKPKSPPAKTLPKENNEPDFLDRIIDSLFSPSKTDPPPPPPPPVPVPHQPGFSPRERAAAANAI